MDGATPYALSVPRRVPLPLLEKVKTELQRMESEGVIRRIEEVTDSRALQYVCLDSP